MTEIVKGAWAKNSAFFPEEMLTDSQHFFEWMSLVSKTVFFTVASFKHRLPAVFETLLSPFNSHLMTLSNPQMYFILLCFLVSWTHPYLTFYKYVLNISSKAGRCTTIFRYV